MKTKKMSWDNKRLNTKTEKDNNDKTERKTKENELFFTIEITEENELTNEAKWKARKHRKIMIYMSGWDN
jgi:hypothetical protein